MILRITLIKMFTPLSINSNILLTLIFSSPLFCISIQANLNQKNIVTSSYPKLRKTYATVAKGEKNRYELTRENRETMD